VSALQALKPGGRSVSVGSSSGQLTAEIPVFSLLGKTMLTYRNSQTPPQVVTAAFHRMLDHIKTGELIVDLEEFPLENAAEAWQLQSESPHRKLVLTPTIS
jgi:NADPH:quinone reductase-like Zn-dependent oxidoreductase